MDPSDFTNSGGILSNFETLMLTYKSPQRTSSICYHYNKKTSILAKTFGPRYFLHEKNNSLDSPSPGQCWTIVLLQVMDFNIVPGGGEVVIVNYRLL